MLLPAALAFALASVQDAPDGWVSIREADVLDTRIKRPLGNYLVTIEAGKLRVQNGAKVPYREASGLPVAPNGEKPTRPPIYLGGLQISVGRGMGIELGDGWLSGWGGDYRGGGILHVAKSDGKMTVADRSPTVALSKTSRGIFAVQAYNHVGSEFGHLVELLGPRGGWRTRFVTDLHFSPDAAAPDGERFLFAFGPHISLLETDGRQREIYRLVEFMSRPSLQAHSIVRHPNGDVWVGATRAILRLRSPKGEVYKAQWFAPAPPKTKG